MVLNGSPRKMGNTAALIEAFGQGAEEAGHSVQVFDLQQMNIHPCLGCCRGGQDPQSPCVQKDDMDKIYPAYQEADVVVLASPLYYWNVSGQLKCAFDRLFAVAECNANYQNPQKVSVLLMAAEGDEFAEALYWYDRCRKSALRRRHGRGRYSRPPRTKASLRPGANPLSKPQPG